MRDREVTQDVHACADARANTLTTTCRAPTIRELIEQRTSRSNAARRAEKLTSTVNETVPISDNSPLQRGGGRHKSHGDPAYAPTGLGDVLCGAEGLNNYFPSLIPKRPYCADQVADGLMVRSRAAALRLRHVQLNGPTAFTWMVHDIDHPGSYFAHDDANLPPPNIIMINPANGRAHAAYLMSVPVARHEMARLPPLRYYAAVERGVARRLDADRCYTGLIAKNPLHPHWRVEWRRNAPYTLHEIADWLFERDMRPDPSIERTFGAGRNVTLFDDLRRWAYSEVRNFKADGRPFEAWNARCLEVANAYNRQFPRALGISEVRSIARSVAKWTWKHFSVEKFIAKQKQLSKLGHAKRWSGGSAKKTQPWKAHGISRAQYYRRKKAGTL